MRLLVRCAVVSLFLNALLFILAWQGVVTLNIFIPEFQAFLWLGLTKYLDCDGPACMIAALMIITAFNFAICTAALFTAGKLIELVRNRRAVGEED